MKIDNTKLLQNWPAITQAMDDTIREEVHSILCDNSEEKFFTAYCERDPSFEAFAFNEFSLAP
jgi:hypothetical protein